MSTDPSGTAAASASSAGDLGPDYGDTSVTVAFALSFNAVKTGLWWTLWLAAVAAAFYRRRVVSRAWTVYSMLLLTTLCNGIQTSAYLAWAVDTERGGTGTPGYLVYLAFFNLGRSGFLVGGHWTAALFQHSPDGVRLRGGSNHTC